MKYVIYMCMCVLAMLPFCDKIPVKINLKEGSLILAHGLRAFIYFRGHRLFLDWWKAEHRDEHMVKDGCSLHGKQRE